MHIFDTDNVIFFCKNKNLARPHHLHIYQINSSQLTPLANLVTFL